MRDQQFLFGFLCLCLGTSSNAQYTLTLTPSHDAVVGYHDNYNSANTNYNGAIHYSAIAQPGATGGVNKNRGLMKFDLSPIPSDATVWGAYLSLSASGPIGIGDVASVGSVGQNACKLYRITSAWNDYSVTWNTQPSFTMENAVPLAQSTYTMQNYLSIDVTNLVQDMVNDPANSFGFMLKLDNEVPTRGLVAYGMLAPNPDKRPVLVVAYGTCRTDFIDEPDQHGRLLSVNPSITSPGSTIQLDMGGNPPASASLVLIDALGQVVHTQMVNHSPVSLTVPALASGTYTWLLRDLSGKRHGTTRMVIRQ